VRDYLAPVLRESRFKEHGRITPEEFVAAGDFLVYKFPTWSWEGGDKSKRRDYLPEDKQYLISRNGECAHFACGIALLFCLLVLNRGGTVPCLRRCSQMVYTDADEDAEALISALAEEGGQGDDEDWVATHSSRGVSFLFLLTMG
jgi:ubiquitin-like-conjugating enzyme ATG3